MNLHRYEHLLSAIASDLARIGDSNGARVFLRWCRDLKTSRGTPHPNLSLTIHVAAVRKSARAVVVLASERYLSPLELKGPDRIQLESALEQLLGEAKQVAERLTTINRALTDRGLQGIVGLVLSSVEFVFDYVQFHFHGSTLSAFSSLEVRDGESLFRVNTPGYRDALCRRIGIVVDCVEVKEGQELVISFQDGGALRISLRPEDRAGPESATFSSASGGIWIW